MKIAFCSLPLKSGHKTRGIGFYTQNLLAGLKKRSDIKIYEFSHPSEIKDADIVHYPFFDLFQRTLPINKKFPTVATIHDVIPLIFPWHYPPGIKGRLKSFYQKLSLKNVKAVITDSKSSKKDIVKFLNVNPKKVFPISLASTPNFKVIYDTKHLSLVQNKHHLPQNFALYIGSVNWNKNLSNMTAACMEADIDLVLAGKDFEDQSHLDHPERKSYSEFLQKFASQPKVHILGFVPDEDLVAIINLSQMVLLPSFYEGFGLPILEAQACEIPVIIGNVSSMPEVAGDGAILVDPESVQDIACAISKILNNKIFKNNLILKGTANLKRFSWDKTINQTIKVYQYVLTH